MYNQFLGLMMNEKAAKETYLKAVGGNMSKVEQMKNKLKKESGDTNKSVLMIALLDNYGKVLGKLEESLKGEVVYMEEKFICKLASALKQNKTIVQNLNASIDSIHSYTKQLTAVFEYKRAMFSSYTVYEQTSLIDEAIARVVQTYSDDCPRKGQDPAQIAFKNKEYEYTTAVKRFNEEAPGLLASSVSAK